MMNTLVTGIHHITSLASDAQKNVDFYAGILGLRLVKKTINFDVLKSITYIMAMRKSLWHHNDFLSLSWHTTGSKR